MANAKQLVLGHVARGTGRHRPFDQVYAGSMHVKPEDIKDDCPIDALVIWGGEDISPSIYGDTVHAMCGASSTLSERDRLEVNACLEAIDRDIPIIGVCRGAQLVCALAGGRLIQHVDNHGGNHMMETFDGQMIVTSSVHHQMMYPFNLPKDQYSMIAWADKPRSTRYMIGDKFPEMLDKMGGDDRIEPEIIWFPKIKALAIQGHPEFHSDPYDPFVTYCMNLVRSHILHETEVV